MKKFLFAIFTMIILVSLFSSCNNTLNNEEQLSEETSSHVSSSAESTIDNNDNTELIDTSDDTDLTSEIIIRDVDFNQYLDDINFVPRLSQSDFKAQMATYTYNGKKITDITEGWWYDGLYGGGYSAWSENIEFCNDYTVTADEKYSIYTNELYTKVQLDGLKLPNDINVGYTLSTVLMSFNLNVDLDRDFADAEDATVIIHSDESSSLKLTNCSLLDGTAEKPQYSYQLMYEESYPITYQNGKEATVTRYVKMFFTENDAKFGAFEVAVIEKCDRNQ